MPEKLQHRQMPYTTTDGKEWHYRMKEEQTAEWERRGNTKVEGILWEAVHIGLYNFNINVDEKVLEQQKQTEIERKNPGIVESEVRAAETDRNREEDPWHCGEWS